MKKVLISAGHSNTDSGAVNGARKESLEVVKMRNMVAHYLDVAGVPYITDGKGNENATLNEAIKLAKSLKATDIKVEFHFNAGPATAKGTEVLSAVKDKALAQDLAKAINSVMGGGLRGTAGWKPEDSGQHQRLGFISTGGGLIVEIDFISNDNQLRIWDAKCWLVAKAVADVLIEWAGK